MLVDASAQIVTKRDVLEHAKEIALQQGAVMDTVNYFETEDGESLKKCPTRETLDDFRHCRVCVAGAAILAAVRLGYGDKEEWYGWYQEAKDTVGVRTCRGLDIEDNPHEIVRILDLMIERA